MQARAGDSESPKRFVGFFAPNGVPMPDWKPLTMGAGYDLRPCLEPLLAIQSQVSVLSGLQNSATNGGAGHAPSSAGFLTNTGVAASETNLTNSTSVDQVYAQSIQGQTPQSSLVLGMIGGTVEGGCDAGGYGCAYLKNISWNGNTPLPKLSQPTDAFDLLFAGYDDGASLAEQQLRRAKRLSVLDSVLDEASSLQGRLGATDRIKVEEYLDSVRDLELRVEANDPGTAPACSPTEPEPSFDIDAKCEAFLDVIAMAFECDVTRSVTFMCGEGLNSLDFDFLGFSDQHHGISHSGAPDDYTKYVEITRWEVEKFASLCSKLLAIDEGGATALDSSILYMGNEISHGAGHTRTDMPVLLAGGLLDTGRHMAFQGRPMGDMFISILGALGVQVNTFGDHGTQPLEGL